MKEINNNISAHYYTLGCKLNFAETSTISDNLEQLGIRRANEEEKADICIINTCTVTETAHAKCRQTINKAIRENPNSFIVVIGCFAQAAPDQIAKIKGVNLILGMEYKSQVAQLIYNTFHNQQGAKHPLQDYQPEVLVTSMKEIKSFMPSCSSGERTRYFLKIQDGCDYFCTYCAIPYARGRSRNLSIASLIEQAEKSAEKGAKEIVITGVNIGDFGKTTGESFINLLKGLDKVEGIDRYRISSIEPNLLTEEVIDFCASSRSFMPHFHIPLQSGSDDVLKLMHRKYDTQLFRSRIEYIKRIIPDAFIGVDVIVGTRGELPEYFENSYNFIKSIDISQLHVFSYSERPGTAALHIPYIVDEKEKHIRSQRLIKLSEEKHTKFYNKYIGTTRPVLFEHTHHGNIVKGFTDNYIRVETLNTSTTFDNKIINIKLSALNEDGTVQGTIIDVD